MTIRRPGRKLSFTEKVYQRFYRLLANDQFSGEIKRIRRQFGIPKHGLRGETEYFSWLMSFDAKKFHQQLEELTKQFKLLQNYDFLIIYFIELGKIVSLSDFKQIHITPFQKMSADPNGAIIIKIFPETTIKDIQEHWSDIQSQKSAKQYSRPNLMRDLYVLSLKKQGFRNDQIAKVINRVFKDNANIEAKDVPKLIKRLRKN